MSDLEERLARAMDKSWDGLPGTSSLQLARAALAFLREQGVLVEPISQDTCKHYNAISTGFVGSDGSSSSDFYCPTCHKEWHLKTPARAPLPAPPRMP